MVDRRAGAGRGGEGVVELDDAACAALLPARPPRSHKGTYGTLLVVAGSLDYAGAALLVARAAGRAGAGLVTLAVPGSLQPLFAGRVLEATTIGLPETEVAGELDPDAAVERILDFDHDAVVLGPGLRPGLATVEFVERLLAVAADGPDGERRRPGTGDAPPPPAVLDAEALNSLATLPRWWERVARSAVLTPHPGEFQRLRAGDAERPPAGAVGTDDAARAREAASAASDWRQTVVLKGARTVVAAPDGRLARAVFENPALASAGTGDVLAGVIGSLLAQGLLPYDAARLGVYLHGLAGEAVRERLGNAGLLASDLLDELPLGRRRLALARERLGGRAIGFTVSEPAG
jgi:hydroxyethylthiazole kinase-like uncharacterized protein yjeF